MSNKHLRRAEILTQVISGKLSTPEAAQLLGMTTRQVRRLRHRFTTEGVESVVHGNTGRAPQNRTDPALIERLRMLAGRVAASITTSMSRICLRCWGVTKR